MCENLTWLVNQLEAVEQRQQFSEVSKDVAKLRNTRLAPPPVPSSLSALCGSMRENFENIPITFSPSLLGLGPD